MTSFHGEFGIENLEAGRGTWHARTRRASHAPLVLNGVEFSHLEVVFARPERTAAIDGAKTQIDRFGPRWAARNDTSDSQLTTIAQWRKGNRG